jgi:hypothetical protein
VSVDDVLFAPIPLLDPPVYELIAQCFLDGRLVDRGERIVWTERPNHAMKPISPAAERAYQGFIEQVGSPS